ncbi:hypothetical protein ABKV19_025961 [Rosa sericea]
MTYAKPKPEAETLSSSQQCRHRRRSPNQQPHRCPLTPPTPSAMPLRSSSAASAPMLCDWEPQSFLLSFKLLGLRFCFTFKLSRRSAFSSLLDFKGGKSASTRIVNCVLALKSYSDWKQAGGSGSWKFVGNLKPPISGKPFLRKNSEPFMSSFTRTLSWSERSQDSFSSEDPNEASSSHSLHKLVREVLLDKKQEEIPFVKAPSKDSPGPDSDSPSLSEPGSGDIKNEEKAATEIKKDDCCNQTYDHQEGSKEKYSEDFWSRRGVKEKWVLHSDEFLASPKSETLKILQD